MNEVKDIICIACPRGCHLKITLGKTVQVANAKCKRGEAYGIKEVTHPTRIVTSTMKIIDGIHSRIPVRTSAGIPKALIFDCMVIIDQMTLEAPIIMGEILVENVLNTGVNIIASRSMKRV